MPILLLVWPTVQTQLARKGCDALKRRLHALRVGVTILALLSSIAGAVASGTHTVRKGDTLWGIAKRFQVNIDDIKRANGVSSNKPLPIGIELQIPKAEDSPSQEEGWASKIELQKKAVARFGARLARRLAERRRTAAEQGRAAPEVVRTALAYRGARYRRGGTGARGFDCSGFTRYIYAKSAGIRLPHCSAAQASCGRPVARSGMRPGDLVFFHTRRRGISHVGLYIGGNRFIHASTPKRGVLVSSLNERYYAARFRGARRVAAPH